MPLYFFSFGLVTFQAAIEFLKSNEFETLKSSTQKVKKEVVKKLFINTDCN